jgi:hypothetical protein
MMLWTWPALSSALAEVSSFATRVKIVAGALTEVSMAVLAVMWLVRRAQGARVNRRQCLNSRFTFPIRFTLGKACSETESQEIGHHLRWLVQSFDDEGEQ